MIRLSRSIVGKAEADAVARVLVEDGYLGMGAEVQKLEAEIAAFLGVEPKQVCCVSSGTAAVQLGVQAVTEPGDEVLVQSLTFIATFQAISGVGAVPVPCEVRPETMTIDLKDAERRITPKTKAIVPVHYASYPGDLDAIYDFASRHNLRVVEDAAHAFGCTYKGRLIGSFGDVACFSFDGIKNITCGEGGAIVARDPETLAIASDSRLLGVQKDAEKRYAGQRSWEFDVTRQGFRYHMSNIMAAIGRVQLQRFPNEFSRSRVTLAERYRQGLAGIPNVMLLETDLGPVIPHIQPIRITGGLRDTVREALEAAGVQTGIHYKPNHLLTLYGGGSVSLPVTEQLYEELLSLPLHPGISEQDVDLVCRTILDTVRRQKTEDRRR